MEESEKKGMGCFAKGCITLVIVSLLLLVIGGGALYLFYSNVKNTYTSATPAQIPVKDTTEGQYATVHAKVEAFQKGVSSGVESRLELTADEINALIARDPKFQLMKGKCRVRIEKGQLKAETAFPLDQVPMFKGRYLNGTVDLRASVENGKAWLTAESFSVNGQQAPSQFMESFKHQNLADKINQDPKFAPTLEKIKSLKIENDRIIILTNGSPAPTEETTAPSSEPSENAPALDRSSSTNSSGGT